MKNKLKQPILARTLNLFFIFSAGLIIVIFSFSFRNHISNIYTERADQQDIQQYLGQMIFTQLTALENEFNKIDTIDDPRDLDHAEKRIEKLIKETHDILFVLQNGGDLEQIIPANFGEMNEIERKITYYRPESEGYQVAVLELSPRLFDLEEIAKELIATVDESLGENDPDLKLDTAKRTSLLLKQADTLFLRSSESANRIYYDSNLEMQTTSAEKDKTMRRVDIISATIIFGVVIIGGRLSYGIFQQIDALLKERRIAENTLREAESRYRTVADFTYDWEYWRTPDGKLAYISPSCERITGYSVEDFSKTPDLLQEIVLPEDKDIWNEHGLEIKKEYSSQEIRFRIKQKNGKVIWIEHACRPVTSPTGEFVGYRASNREISERIKAENTLRENEELYRSLVENSPIGILLASPDGEIRSVNEATLEIIGSPSKEATKKINLLSFPPIAQSSFTPDFKTCLATGERVKNRMAYTSKWGRKVYVRYTFTSIRGAKEEPRGILVLLDDITEQILRKNDIERQVKNLATINAINTALITRTNQEQMIAKVIKEIAKNLSVDAADLLIFDEITLSLTCTAQYGFQSPSGTKKTVLRVGEGYAGKAALKRKTVKTYNLTEETHKENTPQRWQDENFSTYIGVPLLVKGKLKGILEVFHRTDEKRSPEWMSILETLAQQAAIAIDNHSLLSALRHSKIELELAYETTLEGWARALELRDYETKGHTERVANLTLELAQNLGIYGDKLAHIKRGALLHDIGKIAISDTILLKPGPCTPEEWKMLYQHPQYGYDMLKEIDYLKPSLDIVLYHHEKWDGSGYPHGLAKERIPFSARIFAITDVWDAIINARPYHEAWTKEEALTYIQEESGKHFDPQVVEAFLQIAE